MALASPARGHQPSSPLISTLSSEPKPSEESCSWPPHRLMAENETMCHSHFKIFFSFVPLHLFSVIDVNSKIPGYYLGFFLYNRKELLIHKTFPPKYYYRNKYSEKKILYVMKEEQSHNCILSSCELLLLVCLWWEKSEDSPTKNDSFIRS